MRKKENSNKLFAVKPGENNPLGTPTLRWKNIIEVEHGIRVGGCELDSAMNLEFTYKAGNYLTSRTYYQL
jgi:hypothetical protein